MMLIVNPEKTNIKRLIHPRLKCSPIKNALCICTVYGYKAVLRRSGAQFMDSQQIKVMNIMVFNL